MVSHGDSMNIEDSDVFDPVALIFLREALSLLAEMATQAPAITSHSSQMKEKKREKMHPLPSLTLHGLQNPPLTSIALSRT